ncbi:MAG: chromosomal replication initiator protein DnaA [Bdellovibrionota bacterium]
MENFGRMERVGDVLGSFAEAPIANPKVPSNSPLTNSLPNSLQRSQTLPATANTEDSSGDSAPEIADESILQPLPISPKELQELWTRTCAELQNQVDVQIYTAWLRPLRLLDLKYETEQYENGQRDGNAASSGGAIATLAAPNKFCSDHVQRHYSELIRAVLAAMLVPLRSKMAAGSSAVSEECGAVDESVDGTAQEKEPQLRLLFRVEAGTPNKPVSAEQPQGKRGEQDTARSSTALHSSAGNSAEHAHRELPVRARKSEQSPDDTNLNPKYNFSNFVVGSCNQLAHAVGLKVAESLGSTYNPLFVYGGVGLGKTHLANAIGNSARRRCKKVLLVSSETFVSELIASLRSNRMDQFKSKFRSLDLLIIDDIQFIIGKERTQEEFFHTFNDLYNRHKQIIITCDKVPQELVGLEERLRTRFSSGLSVDLQAPDFETRVAILNKKAEAESVMLPEDVARCLAERINTNVRELEGALNRLKALSSLQKTGISRELAEEVLRSLAPLKMTEVTSELIQRIVAERFNVSVHDLLGKRRTQNIALARQVAMYLCRRMTALSFPEIGAFFGGRDHSTVIHAQKSITEKLAADAEFRANVRNIEKRIRA